MKLQVLKSVTIPFFFTLATLPLQATVEPLPVDGEWDIAVKKGQAQLAQHKLAEAAESAGQALRIAKGYGDKNYRVAVTYYQLGNIYREWAHCGAARTNYSRSIAAWKKVTGPEPRYVLNSIVSLVATLCECDQFDAAEKTFRAYDSELQRYQSGLLDEAALLGLRATIFRTRKNYGQAESYYRRAIQLLEQAPDGTPAQAEEQRVNLATVLDKQGRHSEALAESERVISFFTRNPPSRPTTLIASLNNAACSLADMGRKEESEHMFERALATATAALGEDSRFTAKVMLNYARLLRENRDTHAADAMQKKGAAAWRRALVRDNATVDILDLK